MKINEIIRERRTAMGFTQEQVASYMGVSAPAVHKWERGSSYPDITLLPSLARLLGTDMNTLLSFQEELTRQEISNFLNELFSIATAKGMASAFEMAMEKIREYPSCEILLLNTALALESMVSMYVETENGGDYLEKVEQLYLRASKSKDAQVGNQAKAMLASKYMVRQEFEQAEKLLEELPEETAYQKKQLQANLYARQEKWEDALRITEQKLLTELVGAQSSLFLLVEIALKEKRMADAEQLAGITTQMVEVFDLWEYNSYVAAFECSVAQKDAETCFSILEKMIPAMQAKWNLTQSVLYCHLPKKEEGRNIGEFMIPKILNVFEDTENQEFKFLREAAGFQDFMADIKKKVR